MKIFKKSTAGRTLHYFFGVEKKRKLPFAINLIFPTLAIFLGETLVAYQVGKLVQNITTFKAGDDAGELYSIGWTIILLYVAHIIVFRINDYIFIRRHALSARDLEQSIFSKLPKHSYRFFSENYGGALVSQINRFLKGFYEYEHVFLFDYMQIVARIALSSGILLFIAPTLGILLGVWGILFIFSVTYLLIKQAHVTREEAGADSKVIAFLSDAITNMVTIKTFAHESFESRSFSRISNERYKKRYRSWKIKAHVRDFRWFLTFGFFVTYIFLSIYLVINNIIEPSAMVASQIYIFGIISHLLLLHVVIQKTEQLFADSAELTDILDLEPELKDPENPETPKINKGLIKFNSVEFKYPNTSKNVFSGLDLEIQSAQRVGLVGHSGSGKSTITRLVLRFFDVKAGEILIDGQNIAHITQDDLRNNIAYIPQEPILFHRSLKDNIAYGREDATDEEIYEASRLAYADNFIQDLPDKYNTLVGERGVKLSGGEKQRVAIARAMLTRAPILILDEATSALDSKSEKYITKALDKLMNGRTTIVIAHRLSTIRKLDRIIVLKNGEVIEGGTHKELLELGGEYSELWSHQTGNFLDTE